MLSRQDKRTDRPSAPAHRTHAAAIAAVWLVVAAAVTADLFAPFQYDLRRFSPQVMAAEEAAMWRAYYAKRPWPVFRALARVLHGEQGFPWLRAHLTAAWGARAAFLFKRGKSHEDYERAMGPLTRYYGALRRMGRLTADPEQVARLELTWWIAHREDARHDGNRLGAAVAAATAALYGEPEAKLGKYGRLRADAMMYRDETAYGAGGMTPDQWRVVESLLTSAYNALHDALNDGFLVAEKVR